jgi:hypothetical protein
VSRPPKGGVDREIDPAPRRQPGRRLLHPVEVVAAQDERPRGRQAANFDRVFGIGKHLKSASDLARVDPRVRSGRSGAGVGGALTEFVVFV